MVSISKALLKEYKHKSDYLNRYSKLCRTIQIISLSKLNSIKYRLKNRQAALELFRYLLNPILSDHELNYKNYFIMAIGTIKTCCNLLNNNATSTLKTIVKNLLEMNKKINLIAYSEKITLFAKKNHSRYLKKKILKAEFESVSFTFATILVNRLFGFGFKFNNKKDPGYAKLNRKKIDYDKCIIIFNRYVSITEQVPAFYTAYSYNKLLRFYHKDFDTISKFDLFKSLFFVNLKENMNKVRLLKNLCHFGYTLIILDCLEESEYCQYASRSNVMKHAHQASKDLAAKYLREYHKIRQELITRELSEIVAAVDA